MPRRRLVALAFALSLGAPAASGAAAQATLAANPAESRVDERAELDAAVSRIRRRYATIERSLEGYVRVRRDLEPGKYSAAGGHATAWFSDAGLRKIAATHLGEAGRTREQLYFWGDTLFFAYEVREDYDGTLSGRVVRRTEQRYYFADTTLVGWVGTGRRRPVPPPTAEVHERGAELRRHGAELRALVEKGDSRQTAR